MKIPAALTLCLFAAIINACSGEKNATEYIEAARSHKESGDLQAALIEGRNAIRLDTANSSSRAFVGELELLTGSPSSSEKELLKAIELGATDTELSHLLSKAYLLQGKHKDLMAIEVDGLPKTEAADVRAYQAHSTLSQGDISKAEELIQDALALNAVSLTALTTNARLRAVANDFTEAKKLLTQALGVSDTHSEAWELLGDIESTESKFSDAVISYTKAADTTPNKLPLILKRAQTNLGLKEYAAVQTDLDRLNNSGVKLPIISLLKSEILFAEGKFLEAQTVLEEGLTLTPDSPILARSLALTHLMLDNLGQAEQYAKQYYTSANTDDALVLQAAIRLQQGRAEQAEQTLQPLLEANRLDAMGSRILATSFLKQDKFDEAITTMIDLHTRLDIAGVDNPPDLALLTRPSNVLSIELLNILPQPGETQNDDYLSIENMSLVTAVTYVASGTSVDAKAAVEELAKLSPEHPAINDLIGRINVTNKDFDAARASFEASNNQSTSSALFLALLDINANNVETGITRLTDSLSTAKGMMRERVLMTLANIEESTGNIAKMLAWPQQAKNENKSAYLPTIALAKHYFQTGNLQEVINTISSLTPTGKKNPQSIRIMAQTYLALEQFEEAKNLLTPIASQMPNDPEWHYLRAGALAGLGDITGLTSDLNFALRANPDHVPSLIAKTNLDIQSNRLEIAAKQLAQLENLVPDASALAAISDRLNERSNINAAVNNSSAPESTEEVMKIAKILWSDAKQDEAVMLMSDWLKENPNDITILLTLGNTYTSLNKQAESINMFKSVLKLEPTHFIALNNLAWQLRDDDPNTAIAYVTEALQQQPDNIATLDTLAMIHYGQGNYSEAEKAFRKIQPLKPRDPTILFHGAKIEVALGNTQAAKNLLEPLVSSSLKFPEAMEAKALLESL